MLEQYTDVKNNTYAIIHKILIDKQVSKEEREQRIVEELYRILIRK